MQEAVVWIVPFVTWLLLSPSLSGRAPDKSRRSNTRLCPIIIFAIIFNDTGSRPARHYFPSFQQNNSFIFKLFQHEIIDETGMRQPVGVEHDGLCRQREAKDGQEGTRYADLRPELSASLSAELPSGLLPKEGMILNF
jgi:hypothetical protein